MTKMLVLCITWLLAGCAVGDDSDQDVAADPDELAVRGPTKLIALGGSITAGQGLDPHTTNSFTGCPSESPAAYPALMARSLGLELVQAACSGATAANILPSRDPDFEAQRVSVTDAQGHHVIRILSSQFDKVKNDLRGNIVVLFVGGNDTGYIGDIITCFTHTGCPTDAAHTADFKRRAKTLEHHITALIRYIEAQEPAKILVNEYYAVAEVESDVACVPSPPYHRPAQSPGIDWLKARLSDLNNAIRSGAQAAGHSNVKLVSPVLVRHYICAVSPNKAWVAGPGLHDGATAHPTYEGQAYLARLNEEILRP
jgi:hypothetical protein